MAKQLGLNPSREVWGTHKDLIYDLYLKQNQSLVSVTAFLNENCGFDVTPRQIKARLKEWGYDKKRTFAPFYRAMLVVADHRRNVNALDTVFQVPKKASREEVCVGRVKKEVDRQKGELHLPSLEEAERLLMTADITWCVPQPENSADHLDLQTTTQDQLAVNINPSEDWTWVTSDEEGDGDGDVFTEMVYSRSDSPFHLIIDQAVAPSETSHVDTESLAHPFESRLHSIPDMQPYQHQLHAGLALPNNDVHTPPCAFHGLANGFNHCRLSPSCHSHQHFDLWEAMALLRLADEHKMHVGQWAGPWYLHAFGDSSVPPTSKADGIEALKEMLKQQPDNQYVFPCLSWMITILGSNGKHTELKEFLTASCLVIDEVTTQNPLYSSIFHYALAVQEENDADKRIHGENFSRFHEAMKLVWRETHPNLLVYVSFWAWYLLDEQKFTQAIRLLESSLPTFDCVMGRYDLLTINCRAILSRAYEATGSCAQAICYLEQAIQYLGNHRRELNAVKMGLHGRLGNLKRLVGDFVSAESHLRQCIYGRIEMLGLQDPAIWYFIDILCEILSRSNRHGDVDLLLQDLQHRGGCPQRELEELRNRVNYGMRWGMPQMYD